LSTTEPIPKKNTLRNYQYILSKFSSSFPDRDLESISSDEILSFLSQLTGGTKQATKRSQYALLAAFFTLIKNTLDSKLANPCDTVMLRKLFRPAKAPQWTILDKEVIDEIIFRTVKNRDRLMLELMARGGLRVGEGLKLTPRDIEDQKVILRSPKSGREAEVVFIPHKLALRLKEYIRDRGIKPDQKIFPIGYAAARIIVRKAGKLVGVQLRPHDLRRHAATYASRSGTPIEIVSKVILRHANLSTTQRYLGKVSDVEAVRWIENLYG